MKERNPLSCILELHFLQHIHHDINKENVESRLLMIGHVYHLFQTVIKALHHCPIRYCGQVLDLHI